MGGIVPIKAHAVQAFCRGVGLMIRALMLSILSYIGLTRPEWGVPVWH